MKKCILIFLVIAVLFVFVGCTPKYTEEQLDALSRIDPLHLFTENRDFFKKYTKDTLETAKDTYDFGVPVEWLENGWLLTEFYGCDEPFKVGWTTLGKGDIVGFGYYYSTRIGNSYDAIKNYPEWFAQTREDYITVFGPPDAEGFGQTDSQDYEDVIRKLENKETVHYNLRCRNVLFMFMSEPGPESEVEISVIFDLRFKGI